jgi:hypothetical protein
MTLISVTAVGAVQAFLQCQAFNMLLQTLV